AYKANMDIQYLVINEDSEERMNEYLSGFTINNEVYTMKNNLFNTLTCTETPQGAIAVVKNKEISKDIEGEFYLLCDKVQDPGNLGTIIRTAHAAGVDGIILTKGTVDIYNDKVIRSTMGSLFYVPIIHEDENLTYIKELIGDGFSLVATSLSESKDFFEADLKGKVILSVGNEGNGIGDEIFALADKKVKIPMPGGAESLNVAIATSIILFEKVRQNLCKTYTNK
ncbi:MAG: TrmH family RNA methyltransferase, partial [Clostridium sp.]